MSYRSALYALLLSFGPAWPLSAGLSVNPSVSINGNTCDQIVWMDAAGLTREADIVQLAGNPGGNTGGYITRVGYNDGAAPVTCNESGYSVDGTLSGLGQMVNHGGTGNGWVCSNLDGIKAGASTQVLFQGANHAIYQVDMDEWGDNGDHSKGTWHDRWIYFVANGRDDIVESLSYDFSAHPAGYWGYSGVSGQTGHDSRSPYCSFNWSGTGASNTFTESIDGIEYAVRDSTTNSYVFKTVGSSPFSAGYTFNSAASNIPYTLQWKNSPDREIGYVSTLDLSQWAAGGGFTSAVNVGSTGSAMPANWGINYQANGFQSWLGDKMTWGLPYGAAGGATGGSTFPDWTYARNWTGYPTMGYTVKIQLDAHSSDKVHQQVAEQAAIHGLPNTALTAAVGTVQTTGPMNLQDASNSFTFKPQGFNHIYGAWEVACAGGAADITLALGAVSLGHPTFIFDGFTAGSLCNLTLNGTIQIEGSDIFSSVDGVNHRLYVTFNKALTGSAHIAFPASCGSPTPTLTITATPSPASGGAGKQYCVHVDYSAVHALLNYRKITLKVDVGNCASVQVSADGSPIAASYSGSTATFSTTGSNIIVTAVGWTSGGTGAVTKALLDGDRHFAVSQTFDDGLLSPYTNAKSLLDAHGWRAGLALVGSILDASGANYLSWTQVKALRSAGWDMFNHTFDHPTLTCANFAAEFGSNQTDFLSELPGYHVTHIVYPYETISADSCSGFPPGFLISGEALTGASENFVDAALPNVYTAARTGLYGTDPTGWESQVAATAANSRAGWNIFITHEVVPGSGDPSTLTDGLGPYSSDANALGAFYTWLDSHYGASGDGTMWFAPAGEVMDYLMTRDNAVVTAFTCGTPTPTATVCAGCSPTDTFTASPTASPTPSVTPLPACSGNLIDDFEHAPGANSFGGYWYTFATAPSTMNPTTFAPSSPGVGGTGSCARAYGTMASGDALGLGTGLASAGSNVSAYAGISFWVKGDGNAYRFQIHSLVEGGNFNDYKYDFTPPVGWSVVVIPWTDFSFPGWGTAYSLDTTQISGLSWVPMTVGAYDFSVDSVALLCPSATSTPSSTRTPSPSRTPSPTLSATPSSSSSATPSATGTQTVDPSPTQTWTAVPPGSTLTDTPSVSPSRTPSPSASPTSSSTPTVPAASATVTLTASLSVTHSDTPTLSPTPSVTPVLTATFSPTPLALGTATCTAVLALPSSTPPSGALRIIDQRFYPNPNPLGLAVKLEGPADRLSLTIYSAAETKVLQWQGGACPGGWTSLALPPGWSTGLANGVYFGQITAYRAGAVSAAVKPQRLLLLR